MLRTTMLLLLFAAPTLAVQAAACSVAGCSSRDIEMLPTFVVKVEHDKKPLAGVAIEIKAMDTNIAKTVSIATDSNGTAYVTDLAPGDYWIKAELLGITGVGAGSACFHVNDKPSGEARGGVDFTWGDHAPKTNRIAGTLVDVQRGQGGTPLWNLLHPRAVPIVGAALTVVNPITRTSARTWSGVDGAFAFDAIPSGTYVLHVEGGRAGERDYDETDVLVELTPRTFRNALRLTRTEPGGGDCGGTSLEVIER